MMNRRVAALLSAFLLVFAVACGDDDTSADGLNDGTTTTEQPSDEGDEPDDAAATVTVDGAWARTSPMMATNGAAYMQLTASVDDRLIGARSVGELAASVEVHETAMDPDTGEMAMRQTEGVDLPAGVMVALEPGGFHIMFVDLVEPLVPGTTFDLVLVFEQAGEVTVTVEVRDAADMGGGMDDEGEMDDQGGMGGEG
jgi:periplasmic copper chaperone A